jgi:dihydropteroate synthase
VTVPELVWRVRSRTIKLNRPFLLGILNVTPDSFSDGGQFLGVDAALVQAERMVSEGADAIDVGGESTRPQGATVITCEEEIRRVIPVVGALRRALPRVLVSVDTTKAEVAAAAIEAGADIINDVSAFRLDPRMGEIAAATSAGVVLVHSRGGVTDMATYRYAEYGTDVVTEIAGELEPAVALALAAGVARESIVLDPGIGFAKRSEHSLRIISELYRLSSLGYPLLVGVSRKRFVGELSGVENPQDRVLGTVGANVAALMHGARLFRVHDVAPNRQALAVAWSILESGGAPALTHSGSETSNADGMVRGPGSPFPVPGSR